MGLLNDRRRNLAVNSRARRQSSPLTRVLTDSGSLACSASSLASRACCACCVWCRIPTSPPGRRFVHQVRRDCRIRSGHAARGVEQLQFGGMELMLHNEGTVLDPPQALAGAQRRSEEHTPELQSLMRISYAFFL